VEPILCYPDPPSPDVVRALEIGGYAWQAITDEAVATAGVWSAALLSAEGDADAAFAFARAIRQADGGVAPVLLVVRGAMLTELESRHELFDDFIVSPFHPVEFEARLKHLLVRGGWSEAAAELVTYDQLVLNLETYQAIIAGRPLDLTYMEYELLKFLASNPGRVFTRETLLSRVWGYEYYGGARTVDVHVRRLRSKLGEEHAALIQTVRSVGYKFGESRWG
jgi:DNA-binding response OmpR family regulator